MTYKRKYPKIEIDSVAGVITDENNEPTHMIMKHREIKGNATKKSMTGGLQEVIDLSAGEVYGTITLHNPERRG